MIDPSTILFPSPNGSAYSPNSIQDSPPEVEEMLVDIGNAQVDLQVLNLSSNELEKLDERIAGLEDLIELDLHGNSIKTIPSSLFSLRFLTSLNLSHNPLDEFPLEILNLTGLVSLNLAGAGLKRLWSTEWETELAGSPMIGSSLVESPSNSPNRNKNYLQLLPSPSAPLLEGILPHLKNLDLSENPLDPKYLSTIVFPKNLVHLDLSKCQLVSPAVPLAIFSSLDSLLTLNLSHNHLTPDLFQTSFTFSHNLTHWDIEAGCISLTRLDLSHNQITTLGSVENGLLEVLEQSYKLVGIEEEKVMNLFKSAEQFRRGERKNKGVEEEELEIILWGNEIGVEERIRRRGFFPASAGSTTREMNSPAIGVKQVELGEIEKESVMIATPVKKFVDNGWDEPPLTEGGKRRARAAVARLEREKREDFLREAERGVVAAETEPAAVEELAVMVEDLVIEPVQEKQVEKKVEKVEEEVVEEIGLEPEAIGIEDEPNLELIGVAYDSTSSRLNLRSKSLSTFPTLPTTRISSIDWSSLAVIDLSYNKLVSIPTINLPNLKELDLSYNLLTTLENLEFLAFTGLKELKLNGNKVDNLDSLVRIAETFKSGNSLHEKPFLKVLDLSDNEIGKLPYVLGHLGLEGLDFRVFGNRFRIPSAKIYQDSSKSLLEWLKVRDR